MADGRLGLVERRRLGLTLPALLPVVRRLQSEGRITGDPLVDATTVLEELLANNQHEWQVVAGGDWESFFEAVIAFLEKIIPLILTLISLFF